MLSRKILKRFINDYNLPIKIYEQPHYDYLINLYFDYFKLQDKITDLEVTLEPFDSDEAFLNHYDSIRENVISFIKEKEEYQLFNNGNMDKYNVVSSYPKSDIYKRHNTGKYFLSIDLKGANYQALKYTDKNIVGNSSSYDEFISMFTELNYIKKSKYFRQVVFGNLNPKRQMKVARYLTEQVLNHLLSNKIIKSEDIVSVLSDEIVIEVDKDNIPQIQLQSSIMSAYIKEELDIDVDVEVFKLDNIENKGYVKEFINKSGYELKGVSSTFFAQVYKRYNNMPITNDDLYFYHENIVAKFTKSIFEE